MEISQKKEIYKLQAELCSALAHPIRLEILERLSSGETTFTNLLAILDIPKANLSQHLSVLKESGIVEARKEGQFQYISLALPGIKEACEIVQNLLVEKFKQEEKKHKNLKEMLFTKESPYEK